ncbi:MAG: hypothetical protein M1541_11205 [Acidobacteria bacterium]|nr:hypothetical protein [Acidobacteriota bacterium]
MHLKVGETIWQTRTIPGHDLFSYTASGKAYPAHEWLGQLMMYVCYRMGGYVGVMLWLCVLASAVVVGLYVLCALYSGDHLAGLIGAAVGWCFGTVGFTPRPALLGFLFLVLELLLLELGRTRSRRWLWGLPPLFALWVNCHGSFYIGLGALGVAVACTLLPWKSRQIEVPLWTRAARRTLLTAGACSLPALLLNPNGVRALAYPLAVVTKQRIGLAWVQEWAPLTVADPRGIALLGVFAFLFLMVLVYRMPLRLDELLLLAAGACMALQHMRLAFAFGVFAGPVVGRTLARLMGPERETRNRRWVSPALFAASVAIIAIAFPGQAALERQVKQATPQAAVDFIGRAGLHGRMLNDYNWGNYLIWALPEHKVFIDTRSEFYEWAGILPQYLRWMAIGEDPRRLPDKYGIDFCLLRADAPISRVMALLPEWRLAYRDGEAVVLIRQGTQTGNLRSPLEPK